MKQMRLFALALLSLALITSCNDDDEPDAPQVPNEEEVITTLTYTLTNNSDPSDIVVFSFRDLDGPGGDAPDVIPDTLMANATYSGSLVLLNEIETPAEDISDEIEEEDEEHQFFFSTDVAGLKINYGDFDSDDNPVGLLTILETGDAGSGSMTVTLRHEPNKSAAGVSAGDITNAGGETDIEVEFDVEVE